MTPRTRTWFVTGASRGMGRELVVQLLERGDTVAGTLRRPEQLDDLATRFGDRLWLRALDVTDTGAVRRVVGEAFADLESIDVIVSNAGYGVSGITEDLSDEDVLGMIATNLTGSIQLARAVVPHLRTQGGGRSTGHRRSPRRCSAVPNAWPRRSFAPPVPRSHRGAWCWVRTRGR
ncbi:SDR family NAD(P)-dependent oxidoreductase [Mycolicibacterium palauense]|uniref:SDR family NAD(P)-dependent oxidoreductase n=1 Tax=Mycolicibacterium palauense TaxID=2034511 RepID=UPI001C3F3F05|nr:SDR family NAD(P)-dependent oxidoreductase [Mycolicibacterium palauense]